MPTPVPIQNQANACGRRLVNSIQNIFHGAASSAGLASILIFASLDRPGVSVAQTAEGSQAAAWPLPPISIKHLRTLTDTNGIHEFAHGVIPWHGNGYCAEDVARALVAVTDYERVTGKKDARPLAKIYLRYLQNSLRDDGQLWNREGQMVTSGDSYGRVLWGLGYAAAMHPDAEIALPGPGFSAKSFPAATKNLVTTPSPMPAPCKV
jgi:hypothetical protein